MFFIYLDRIIMVYSHKTHALVKLEVENVLDLGILILIIINSITVSEECCLLLWYFQPTKLISMCCTFVTQ